MRIYLYLYLHHYLYLYLYCIPFGSPADPSLGTCAAESRARSLVVSLSFLALDGAPKSSEQESRRERTRSSAKRKTPTARQTQRPTPDAARMVEKELDNYTQMAPKVVEMGPKRCRNALPGGLQEALEGSWRPLGLQVASGDAPGALLGGFGRAPGAVLGGSRVGFRSLGGGKTASGAALGRLFRTSWRNLCGRPVGGPKMHQKTLFCSLGRVSF